jgi:hypothetical protein
MKEVVRLAKVGANEKKMLLACVAKESTAMIEN